MNKVLLSTAVVVAFFIYGLQQRSEGQSSGVIAPIGLTVASTPTPSPVATASPAQTATGTTSPTSTPKPTASPAGRYKNGSYTGSVADAIYGNVQVKATVSGGKLTDVTFLQYPKDRSNSVYINNQAMPYLKQEAIAAQSAQVNGVSGASYTSAAFIESLGSALSQAS